MYQYVRIHIRKLLHGYYAFINMRIYIRALNFAAKTLGLTKVQLKTLKKC